MLLITLSVTITRRLTYSSFFFFNDTATTEIYTLSLHDALPICQNPGQADRVSTSQALDVTFQAGRGIQSVIQQGNRSEEHTSELQSRLHLVCRLLLEKKKNSQHPGISLMAWLD